MHQLSHFKTPLGAFIDCSILLQIISFSLEFFHCLTFFNCPLPKSHPLDIYVDRYKASHPLDIYVDRL
jgi:hypothetical protein